MQTPDHPTTNGSNGRDARGRFAPGNPGGPGSPYIRRVARLRAELYRAVSAEDLHAVIQALLDNAKAGDVASAKELLSRLLGPPEAIDVLARLEALEARLADARVR